MFAIRLIFSVCALAFGQASAQPIDIKGLVFGANASQVKKVFPGVDCFPGLSSSKSSFDSICAGPGKYAGEEAEVNFLFFSERMGKAVIQLHRGNWSALLSGLIQKYGKPQQSGKHEVILKSGAKFPGEYAQWKKDDVLIEAQEYFWDVNHCGVGFTTLWYESESEKRTRAGQKDM